MNLSRILSRILKIATLFQSDAKIRPEQEVKLRIEHRRLTRRVVKHNLRIQSCRTGYAAKAKLIRQGRGKNGRSMSPALLARHGIQ